MSDLARDIKIPSEYEITSVEKDLVSNLMKPQKANAVNASINHYKMFFNNFARE